MVGGRGRKVKLFKTLKQIPGDYRKLGIRIDLASENRLFHC